MSKTKNPIKLLIGVLALVGLSLVLFNILADLKRDKLLAEEIRQIASQYTASIHRDAFGVPNIHGPRDADAAFGLGYAHAEDDWLTIQTTLVAARGQLARYQGQEGAVTDYIVRLLQIRELVSDRYQTDLTDRSRALVEGYAHGLNLFAAQNPSQVWDDVLPVTGQDIIAGFVLRTPFMYGLDADIAELFADTRARSISMGNSESAFQLVDEARLPFGSNAITIAPEKSDDGATRLLINSHQPYEGPVAWYEAQIHSDEGWSMAGVTFPGVPLILHGHNQDLAWAHTVNLPDLADIYVLETDGDRYELDEEWIDFDHETTKITVNIWGPINWTVSRDLWWSRHGPVVRSDHGDYAIRYSGMDQIGQVEQWYGMNRASNLAEWMAAMEQNAISSINAIYADREGRIAYVYNARMPVREEGYDWTQYLPGDRSDLIWEEYHQLSDMPIYIDPDSGWILSANQHPFDATEIASNLNAQDYPDAHGIEPRTTNRALRGLDLLRAEETISREDLERIKFDKVYDEDGAVARLINEILAMDFADDQTLSDAQSLLADWDMSTDVQNRQTALGVLTAMRCVGNRHTDDPWLMDARQAFSEAAEELMTHYGRLDPEWGEVNRMVRGDVDMPIGGGPDILRAVYGANHGLDPDGRIRAVAGDTSIMIVEWSAEGVLSSDIIHQYGSATIDSTSPHYDDQASLFVRQEWREIELAPVSGGYNPNHRH